MGASRAIRAPLARQLPDIERRMRDLIYKRTHPGDPNADGVFGCEDCMGAGRRRRFDAIIGVGGISAEPRGWRIEQRLNWVGVGASYSDSAPVGYRGPPVTFDRFVLLEERGPMLKTIASALARYVYSVHRRVVMSDSSSPAIQREVSKVLLLASRVRPCRPLNRLPAKFRWGTGPCSLKGRRPGNRWAERTNQRVRRITC
jgi:hypothetical protein